MSGRPVRGSGSGRRSHQSLVWEGQCSLRAGAPQGFTCPRIRGTWAKTACRPQLSWGREDRLWLTVEGAGDRGSGDLSSAWALPGVIPAPAPQQPAGSSAGTPQQSQPAGGTQAYSRTDRLLSASPSQQLPLDTPSDTALPTDKTQTHSPGAGSAPPNRRPGKPRDQPHQLGGRQQKQEPQSCSLRNTDHRHRKWEVWPRWEISDKETR